MFREVVKSNWQNAQKENDPKMAERLSPYHTRMEKRFYISPNGRHEICVSYVITSSNSNNGD